MREQGRPGTKARESLGTEGVLLMLVPITSAMVVAFCASGNNPTDGTYSLYTQTSNKNLYPSLSNVHVYIYIYMYIVTFLALDSL